MTTRHSNALTHRHGRELHKAESDGNGCFGLDWALPSSPLTRGSSGVSTPCRLVHLKVNSCPSLTHRANKAAWQKAVNKVITLYIWHLFHVPKNFLMRLSLGDVEHGQTIISSTER